MVVFREILEESAFTFDFISEHPMYFPCCSNEEHAARRECDAVTVG
jgi:hypothetical protein